MFIKFLIFLNFSIFVLADQNLIKSKKHKENKPLPKNEIIGSGNFHKVCMDVCSPSYDNIPQYQNDFQQYQPYQQNQFYQPDYFYPNNEFYPQSNQYPQNNPYPPNYPDYQTWCYRNMFRRKYRMDPGNKKPEVFNYKKFKRNSRRNRNYGYDNYMNCQLICYPLLVPENIQNHPSTTTTKKTPKPTKRTTTTTETPEESEEPSETTKATKTTPATNSTSSIAPSINGTNEITEATMLPPENQNTTKLENTTKPAGNPT